MRKTNIFMDTVVDIQVISEKSIQETEAKINRAFHAFNQVEKACSRFSPKSELMQACQTIGRPVELSPILFEPLFFAIEMAKMTDGLFDPTVGKVMEEHGFNRHYLTGELIESQEATDTVTYHDMFLNPQTRTIFLEKPMVIDLGAVAKGFAIDLAAQELKGFPGFAINAGGDLYAGGHDANGEPWKIDIQHPYQKDRLIDSFEISNEAICTSGSYERRSPLHLGEHHLVNPQTKLSPKNWVSCSIIAPFAMMADAFSTAAFLFNVEKGKMFLEKFNLKGMLITSDLQMIRTGGI